MIGLGLLPNAFLFLGLNRAENLFPSVVVGSSVSSTEVSLSSSVSLLSSLVEGSSSLAVSGEISSSVGGAGVVVVSGSSGSLPGLGLGKPGRMGLFLEIRLGRGRVLGLEREESPEDGVLVVVVVLVVDDVVCDLERLD